MVGTASTLRWATSSPNSDPSTAVCLIRGLITAMVLSACTTVGQFWQLSDIYVVNS